MKPDLSFLSKLRSRLEGLFGVSKAEAKPLSVSKQPVSTSTPQNVNNAPLMNELSNQHFAATPTPTPPPAQAFEQGFNAYGNIPLTDYANEFQQAAQNSPLPDPYLPAVLGIMETSGGQNMKYANNPFNWGMQDMESIPYVIDRIYSGIGGRMPYYKNYLESGNLEDFFNSYTPPGPEHGNPSMEELLQRYQKIRDLFPQ